MGKVKKCKKIRWLKLCFHQKSDFLADNELSDEEMCAGFLCCPCVIVGNFILKPLAFAVGVLAMGVVEIAGLSYRVFTCRCESGQERMIRTRGGNAHEGCF